MAVCTHIYNYGAYVQFDSNHTFPSHPPSLWEGEGEGGSIQSGYISPLHPNQAPSQPSCVDMGVAVGGDTCGFLAQHRTLRWTLASRRGSEGLKATPTGSPKPPQIAGKAESKFPKQISGEANPGADHTQ